MGGSKGEPQSSPVKAVLPVHPHPGMIQGHDHDHNVYNWLAHKGKIAFSDPHLTEELDAEGNSGKDGPTQETKVEFALDQLLLIGLYGAEQDPKGRANKGHQADDIGVKVQDTFRSQTLLNPHWNRPVVRPHDGGRPLEFGIWRVLFDDKG